MSMDGGLDEPFVLDDMVVDGSMADLASFPLEADFPTEVAGAGGVVDLTASDGGVLDHNEQPPPKELTARDMLQKAQVLGNTGKLKLLQEVVDVGNTSGDFCGAKQISAMQELCSLVNSTSKSYQKKWKSKQLADMLWELHELVEKSSDVRRSQEKDARRSRRRNAPHPPPHKRSAAVVSLRKVIKDCADAAVTQNRKVAQEAKQQKKRRKSGHYSLNDRTEPPHSKYGYDSLIKDPGTCPNCGHDNLAILPSDDIDAVNDVKLAKYKSQLALYEAGQLGKPRVPTYKSQQLGCFCFQMNCHRQTNGVGE